MIETNAISSGTTARNEAKTKARTRRAPNPPSSASISTPGPSESSPESSNEGVEAGEVDRLARDGQALESCACCLLGLGFSPNAESGSGFG